MDANLESTTAALRALLPGMVERKRGERRADRLAQRRPAVLGSR